LPRSDFQECQTERELALSRAVAVFAGLILAAGEFRHDEKSMNIADMLFELFEQT